MRRFESSCVAPPKKPVFVAAIGKIFHNRIMFRPLPGRNIRGCVHRNEELLPMNRIRTTVCRAALAIAAILGGSLAWGEVTIVGSTWQERQLSRQDNPNLLRNPPPPSAEIPLQPKAAAESEQSESCDEFSGLENWLGWTPCWHWYIDYRFRALCAQRHFQRVWHSAAASRRDTLR